SEGISLFGSGRLQVDFSELAGRTFECLDRCQLCCLCQPEVPPEERPFFREDFPEKLILKRSPRRHAALALKKGRGSCSFLENRRCMIYDNRPHSCRRFPLRFYVGSRVQAELDLSCRGVWSGRGEKSLLLGSAMANEDSEVLMSTLSESKRVYEEFFQNCMEFGVYSPPDKLRNEVASRIRSFAELPYIAKVLEMSTQEDDIDLSKVESLEEEMNDMADLEAAARETAMDSLSSVDPVALPVYCDEAGEWNVFEAKNGSVEWSILDEAGDMHRKRSIDPKEIRLTPPDSAGTEVLVDYLRILNNRDSVLGHAYYLIDDYGYEDSISNVYCGDLATSVLDLLWRTSFLIHVRGGKSDLDGMREGIIFYDMDRLDAPTIGAFV
ncbi:MAG: YkgJ family cysteine cluster protein, partial [Methanomassiliicoccales archaeon]|nr:YkgJ family cysteine cluster protein [Methanomassiliicoccales archaeon]